MTKTEIQVTLDNNEQDTVHKMLQLLGTLNIIAMGANDPVSFRCWDLDHDYKSYDMETLSLLTQLVNDIYYAAEIGFNSKGDIYE